MVFLRQFHPAFYLVLGRLRFQVDLCERSGVGGVQVDPGVERAHIFVRDLHAVMSGLEDADQFTVADVELRRFQDVDVRLRSLPVNVWMQVQIALVELLVIFVSIPRL